MKTLLELKADILKALAHPNRIRIVEALRCEETCNCELAPSLGLEQSNLSRHIALLLQTGIIAARKEGVKTFYRVVDPDVFTILDLVQNIVKKRAEAQLAMLNS
ncbi:MAG: ArsR family transcriptional regulator [Calditrichaeota bacterium]|nr:MAG: ArsR family transcriptional regulator [Calditrichota bacterium]